MNDDDDLRPRKALLLVASDDGDDPDLAPEVPERTRIDRANGRRYRSARRQTPGSRARYLRHRRQLAVAELIAQVIKRYGLTEAALEQCIAICWSEIVGERIAQRAKPKALRDGVLKVGAHSSVWVQELQLRKSLLLETVNTWLHAQRVWLGTSAVLLDIRFGLDDGRHTIADLDHVRRLQLRSLRRRPPPDRDPPPVPPPVRDAILAETSVIADPHLRAIIEGVRTKWGV